MGFVQIGLQVWHLFGRLEDPGGADPRLVVPIVVLNDCLHMALPLKIKGGSGSPLRSVALVLDGD